MEPERAHRQAQKRQLQTVGSDHCSFSCAQKELGKDDFSKIPNGAPTIEDRVSILYERAVHSDVIGLNAFVALASTNPAKLFGLFPRKGTIAVGSDGDIVVWDPQVSRTISAATHYMAADNSIFEGMTVHGRRAMCSHVVVCWSKAANTWGKPAAEFAKNRPLFAPCSFRRIRS